MELCDFPGDSTHAGLKNGLDLLMWNQKESFTV